jgi:glycosyltransferase involved in cell wall biosynthesis
MMRVAHLLPSLEIGGKERMVVDLCSNSLDADLKPMIITHDVPSRGRTLIDAGETPVAFVDRRHREHFATELRLLLDHWKVDLLHIHGQVSGIFAGHEALSGVPRVTTLHTALGYGWRWLLPSVPALRRMDALTAVSSAIGDSFSQLLQRPVIEIPTGVDLDQFKPSFPCPQSETFTIGMVARLHSVKRHRDAIQAIRTIHKRGERIRLLIAGEGSESEALRRLATGIDEIEFLGAVRDPSEVYRRIDAFLMCSQSEGTPLALLEAMACGVPCLVTPVGGMQEFIRLGAAAEVPLADPARLAQRISWLKSDRAARAALRRRALEAIAEYSLERQIQAYADLYRHVVQHTANSARRA